LYSEEIVDSVLESKNVENPYLEAPVELRLPPLIARSVDVDVYHKPGVCAVVIAPTLSNCAAELKSVVFKTTELAEAAERSDAQTAN